MQLKMKVLHMKQIAKMARITPAVTLATLKQSSLARQMLSDLMRKNKRELDLRRGIKEKAGVRPPNAGLRPKTRRESKQTGAPFKSVRTTFCESDDSIS